MKRKVKYILLITLCILFSVFSGGGIATLANTENENLGSYDQLFGKVTLTSFETYDGAYIRDNTPTGLRFLTGISTADNDKLKNVADKDEEGNAIVQFGTLITIKSQMGANTELTFETKPTNSIDVKIENFFKTNPPVLGEEYTGFYTTLVGGQDGNYTDFEAKYYNEIFVARSYVKYDFRGQERLVYANNTVFRSIASVAERAVALDENQSDFVKGIVTSALSEKYLTITYNTNGGNIIENKTVVVGHILDSYDIPETPTKGDAEFGGWYTDENLTTPFEFGGILTDSVTLYAKWIKDTNADYDYSNGVISINEEVEVGDYVAINFSLETDRATGEVIKSTSANKLINNENNGTNSFFYYDENNNLIPERLVVQLGKNYTAVLKIEDTNDKDYKIVDTSASLVINSVKRYSKEVFKYLLLNATGAQVEQISETSYSLVENGKSDYKIVVPNAPKEYETEAANDIQEYFEQATGVLLDIISEADASFSENSKLIVIGETNIASDNNVTVSENIPRGFMIKQINSNVIIVGGSDMGTLCGAYEFLAKQFGFEAYSLDYTYIETGVTDRALLAFDLTDKPDVEYTHGYYYERYHNAALTMRFNYYDDIFLPATGQPWHNTFDYVSPSKYQSSNPDWFVTDSDGIAVQLHYSAHGNETELKAMQDVVYNHMVAKIDESFNEGNYFKYIGFIHEDNSSFASDDSVASFKEVYGEAYQAAMVIQFINPIADRIKDYMAKWDNREMNIVIGAYLALENAPVTEENGEYQPIDESVKLRDNVSVLIADIKSDYARAFEYSNSLEKRVAQWKALGGGKQMYWFYDYYTHTPLVYFDNAYNLKNILGLSIGGAMAFNETAQPHEINPFGTLKTYLTSKLSWDNTLDIHELVDNFFDNYYGVASENMWKMYDRLLARTASMLEKFNLTDDPPRLNVIAGADENSYATANHWTKEILDELMGYINKALDDIAYLQDSNPELYITLKGRIIRESLMPRYLLLEYYPTETYNSQDEFNAEKQQFVADCESIGVTSCGGYLAENIQGLMDRDSMTYA